MYMSVTKSKITCLYLLMFQQTPYTNIGTSSWICYVISLPILHRTSESLNPNPDAHLIYLRYCVTPHIHFTLVLFIVSILYQMYIHFWDHFLINTHFIASLGTISYALSKSINAIGVAFYSFPCLLLFPPSRCWILASNTLFFNHFPKLHFMIWMNNFSLISIFLCG